MMGSLKALQEWCRIQCENYNDVDIRDMTTSFRDGLAFCAIIHKHRPDLIDFESLSKENVYDNNRLAFEVAETQLGIPALLDPEDMVSMKVPDRLSIITYVSQYYNFFTNKSHANPPCMKRPSGMGQIEPMMKRPATPLETRGAEAEAKHNSLSSTCAACGKHVHLVQRFLVDGRLYHRNCFRCKECCSTLLPGSYKQGSDVGTLVCTHHFSRSLTANQNGRPDLSKQSGTSSVSVRPKRPETPPKRGSMERPSANERVAISNTTPLPNADIKSDSMEQEMGARASEIEGVDDSRAPEDTAPRPSTPPNPFDETDEEEEESTEQAERERESSLTGDLQPTPLRQGEPESRPVPTPRRPVEATPPPRPAPRTIQLRVSGSSAVNGDLDSRRRSVPVPRERSHSPGSSSQSSDTPKPKDPPWLALVQSEPKKKPAPPPPPPPSVLGGSQRAGSVPSLKGESSQPASPPQSTNPFDDDDEEEEETGVDDVAGGLAPTSVVVNHPWYNITQATEASGQTSPALSVSPGSVQKKRPAPRPPRPSPTALSTESLCSSSSDHGAASSFNSSSSRPPLPLPAPSPTPPPSSSAERQEAAVVTKSASEPSISGGDDEGSSAGVLSPSLGSSPQRLSSSSPSPPSAISDSVASLPHLVAPTSTNSAPATPQTRRCTEGGRAAWAGTARPPPPRPPTTLSPASAESSPADTPTHSKRTCKENPFNRKASPSHPSPSSRPPKGPRPARPPAPGHGFPLIKRKVQSDQYIPVEDIHGEMGELERQLDELEQTGVELEKKLRDCGNDVEEEHLLVDWFTLIHEKHQLVRREAELVYTAKQQNLEERQADVEYELRCLLNKPEKEWTDEDKSREKELMAELVTIIEQRNQIINNMDQDRQREEEEDKLLEAMLKRKDFHKEADEQKKKGAKFKPMKVLKRLSHKGEGPRGGSPRKDKS